MAGALPRNRGNRSSNRTGSTVSRRLRAAGWTISAPARKHRYPGVFVSTAGDHVSVYVDTDNESRNDRFATDLVAELVTWPQVTALEVVRVDDARSVRLQYTPGRG